MVSLSKENNMRQVSLALLLGLAPALMAQAPAAAKAAPALTPGMAVDATYQMVEKQFVSAAEAMPEEKYGFAPKDGEFKGVKTFAEQVKHVAAVNYFVGASLLGEKSPVDVGNPEVGPENLKTKAEIVKFLKDSYGYAHKAVGSISAKNATKSMKFPFGEGTTTPLGLATLLAFHGMDHYGQMVVYLRMNGIIPPASRR